MEALTIVALVARNGDAATMRLCADCLEIAKADAARLNVIEVKPVGSSSKGTCEGCDTNVGEDA